MRGGTAGRSGQITNFQFLTDVRWPGNCRVDRVAEPEQVCGQQREHQDAIEEATRQLDDTQAASAALIAAHPGRPATAASGEPPDSTPQAPDAALPASSLSPPTPSSARRIGWRAVRPFPGLGYLGRSASPAIGAMSGPKLEPKSNTTTRLRARVNTTYKSLLGSSNGSDLPVPKKSVLRRITTVASASRPFV